LADTARVKISEAPATDASFASNLSIDAASIRVSPNSYFIASFLAVFFTAFFVYLERDLIAITLFLFGAIIVPLLAWTDRIVFDGDKLRRTGVIPLIWNWINRQTEILKIADIEQIETQALRALKRGGNVFYRYRTLIQGNGKTFAFASGGEDYRQMTRKLFAMVSVDALDNRSIELRDYLSEPKETLMKAEFARLPSSEVLENSLNEFQNPDRNLRSRRKNGDVSQRQIEKANDLRRLANELRLSGNLLQSLEAFRRALLLNPFDAWLIFEFARCLHSYASSERNTALQRKAKAALRLAEIRAGQDSELLSRLGESYFQYGDWERARVAFQKALNVAAESFRSVRGLAEVALREGKIAHVIHHFTTAIHFAETNALRRWAQGETEYFSRLNTDENYMDSEAKRMNRLENIDRGKKLSLKIALSGFFAILLGIVLDNTIANVGWACASVSLLIWAGLIMTRNLLAERSSMIEQKEN
jgi:tetratricopeptide (TPR) repeat protein